MFLYGGVFIFELFPHTIVDKACSAPDVVLIAVVTRDLTVHYANYGEEGVGVAGDGGRGRWE